MRILIDCTRDRAMTLEDRTNFRAFSVVAQVPTNGQREVARRVLDEVGRVDADTYVYVATSVIRELAGSDGRNPGWEGSLNDMVTYAKSRGWVDDLGAVRAHIEWQTADDVVPGQADPQRCL